MLNILELCKKKIKNFYFASSSEVYQNPHKIPTDEKEILKIPDIHNPRYSYRGGKITSELNGTHFAKKYLKKFIIFKPHNVYGPDMGNEHVIPEFLKRIKKLQPNEKFLIYSTGQELKSFIHIDDFIFAFDKVFKKKKNFEIYKTRTTEKIKILNLAKLIAKINNKSIKFKKTNILKGSSSKRCPDISKIKNLSLSKK